MNNGHQRNEKQAVHIYAITNARLVFIARRKGHIMQKSFGITVDRIHYPKNKETSLRNNWN